MAPEIAFRGSAAVLALFAVCGFNPQTLAATFTKTATAADLSTAAAYTAGTGVPGTGDTILFNSTITAAQTDTITSAPISIGQLQIVNPAGAITINGPDSLTLNGIVNSNGFNVGIDMSAATQNLTLGGPVVLAAPQSWTVASGRTLTLSGASLNTSGNLLTVTGSGNTTITNADTITATGGITKKGAGTLSITAATSTANTLGAGGTLTLNGGITSLVTSTGTPTSDTSPVFNNTANVSLGGGSLIYSFGVSGVDQDFNNLSITAGESAIEVNRAGSFNSDVDFTGTVTRGVGGLLNARELDTGREQTLFGSMAANTLITSNGTAYVTLGNPPSGTVLDNYEDWAEVNAAHQLTAVAYTATTAATLGTAAQNANVAVATTTLATADSTASFRDNLNQASVINLNGNVYETGGILVTATVATAGSIIEDTVGTGALEGPSGSDLTLIISSNAQNPVPFTISANILDNNGSSLTKGAQGTLILSGNNTFTQGLYIDDGTVQVGSLGALNSATPQAINFDGSGMISGVANAIGGANGGSLATAPTLALGGFNTTVASISSSNDLAGSIPVIEDADGSTFANATLTIANGNGATFNGTLQNGSGSGALGVALSSGTLALAGSNTYTGPTTVNGGTLRFTNTVPASNTFNVAGGATLDVSAIPAGITLNNNTLATAAAAGAIATVNGAVTLSGGTISTGAVGSTLAVNTLTLSSGTLDFNITDPTPASGSSSLISVGTNGLTINGGTVSLSGGAFSSGASYDIVYDLIQYTGSLLGAGAPSLSVAAGSQVNGLSYTFGTSGGFVTLTVAGTPFLITSWTLDAPTGSWANAANWSAGVPNGQFGTATLGGGASTDANLNRTVTLDGNETVGTLAFASPDGESYVIDQGTGGALILDNGTSSATISFGGKHTIDSTVPVELNSNLAIGNSLSTDSLTISGPISNGPGLGANGLSTAVVTKTGPGTLVLGGSNSYGPGAGSVGTKINGGTLQVQNNFSLASGNVSFGGANVVLQAGAPALTLANNFVIGNGFTGAFDANGDVLTLTGVISDTNSNGILSILSSVPGGTVILTGSETNGGATTIGSGATLQVASNTTTGALSGTSAVTDNGKLVFERSDAGTVMVNNSITGSGSLTENSAPNILLLAGTNSYTGGTTITAGTIQLGNSASIGSGNLGLATSTELDLHGNSPTIGGLSGAGAIDSSLAGAMTLSLGNNGNGGTFSGAIKNTNGTVSVVFNGGSTQTLSGANTYTGATTQNAGTVVLTGSIGTPTAPTGAVTNNAGAFNVTGGSLYAASLTQADNGGSINLSGNGTIVLTGNLNADSTNNSNEGLVSLGAGTFTAGSITIGRDGANFGATPVLAGTTTDGVYINGATVNISGSIGIGNVAGIESSANFRMDSGSVTVGGTTLITENNNRFSLLDINGGTFTSTDPSGIGIQVGGTGVLPATGDFYAELLVRGTGVLYTPSVTLGVSTQTQGYDDYTAIGGVSYIGAGGIVSGNPTGTTVAVNIGNATVATDPIIAATAAWSSSVPMTLTNSSTGVAPVFQAADSGGVGHTITLSGPLTGAGGLTKTGAGTLVLSGNNTYSGVTTISGGELNVGSAAALPSAGAITFAGGALQYSASNKVDYSPLFANSTSPISIDTNGQAITFANAFAASNTGGLNVTDALGTGSLTLQAANTFTAPTTIAAGGTLILASGATLDSENITDSGALRVTGAATVGSGGGTGLTLNSASTLSLDDGATNTVTLPGNLTIGGASGSPAALDFEVSSTASDSLSVGGNISYGVAGGVINIVALSSPSAPATGTTYDLISDLNGIGAPVFTLGTQGIIIDGSSYSLSLSNTADDEVLTLTALSSNLNFYFKGSSGPTGSSWSQISNFATDHTGATPQTGSFNNTSNVFLTADDAASGYTSETLDGAYTINSLSFTGTNSTVGNTPAATAGITLAAGPTGGPLTLSATNGFTDANGVNFAAGTGLVVQKGSAAHTISANIDLGGSQTWIIANSGTNPLTVSGVIADATPGGNVSLTKSGAGTLVFNNANTYDGGTIVSNGTLALGPNGALPATGTLTVSGSGTFDVAGNSPSIAALSDGGVSTGAITNSAASAAAITFTNTAPISFSGAITDNGANNAGSSLGLNISGSGSVKLSGSNTFNGPVTVNGALIAASNYALGNSASQIGGLFLVSGTTFFTSPAPNVSSLLTNGSGASGAGTAIILGNTANGGSSTTLSLGAGGVAIPGGLSMAYDGTISDLTASNANAIGNLNVTGGSFLQLFGADTFTGLTTLTGVNSEIQIQNPLALQDSTLDMNDPNGIIQIGGSITAVTLAGLTGAQPLSLANANNTAVTLTIGNNNVSSTFTGLLSDGGVGSSLVKTGTGATTIGSSANGGGGATYTGSTTVSNGTLVIGGSSSLTGAVNVTGSVGNSNLIVQDNAVINSTAALDLGNSAGFPADTSVTVTGTANVTVPAFAFGGGQRLPTSSLTLAQSASLFVDGAFDFLHTVGGTLATTTTNLNGGTLAVQDFILTNGGGNAGNSATLDLNGGTLEALASDPSGSTFLPALAGLSVLVQTGGAIINTNGFTDTIAAPLLHGNDSATDGGLTKKGAGTLLLTAPGSFNGATNVTGGALVVNGGLSGTASVAVSNGATLELGIANALPVAAPLTLSAGVLEDLNGLAQNLGSLTVGPGNSTLSLSTGSSIIFASAGTWTGTLTITNWSGLSAGGGVDTIFFNTTLSSAQLADITFSDGTENGVAFNTMGAAQLSDGEIVAAVPEPGTWAMMLSGVALLGIWQRRRRLHRRGV